MTVNSEWGNQKQLQFWSNPNYLIYWHDVLESVTRLLFRSSLWHQELRPNMFTTAFPWPRTNAYFKNKGHQIFVEFEHNRKTINNDISPLTKWISMLFLFNTCKKGTSLIIFCNFFSILSSLFLDDSFYLYFFSIPF